MIVLKFDSMAKSISSKENQPNDTPEQIICRSCITNEIQI